MYRVHLVYNGHLQAVSQGWPLYTGSTVSPLNNCCVASVYPEFARLGHDVRIKVVFLLCYSRTQLQLGTLSTDDEEPRGRRLGVKFPLTALLRTLNSSSTWSSGRQNAKFAVLSEREYVFMHLRSVWGRIFFQTIEMKVGYLLPTSQPTEDTRLARRQHYRAVCTRKKARAFVR